MDKLTRYQQIIKDVVQDLADAQLGDDDGVETHLIYDEAQGRVMLYRVGWRGKERLSTAVVYLHLRDGKIRIEEDWTEDGVVPCLLEAGVPNDDIVLAFRHPKLRPLTEFAVA